MILTHQAFTSLGVDPALELDWHALTDQMRLTVHETCDSPQQLMLRAHLLMHDSVFGRYFKIVS